MLYIIFTALVSNFPIQPDDISPVVPTVEKLVLQYGGFLQRGGFLQNLKFQGYDERFDEWLDWSELRNVEALHTYLRKHNLARFIPKSGQILEDQPVRRLKVPVPKGMPTRNTK